MEGCWTNATCETLLCLGYVTSSLSIRRLLCALSSAWNIKLRNVPTKIYGMWHHIVTELYPRTSFHCATAPSGPSCPHCRGFTITLSNATLVRTPLDEWSVSRKYLYVTTHNTPGGIRTRNPNKRASPNPRLRQRGHWDRYNQAQSNVACTKY